MQRKTGTAQNVCSRRGRCLTDRPDVLAVLGHPFVVRNFASEGCLESLTRRGLRVSVVAPANTLDGIRDLAPGIASLHPLEPIQSTPRRIRRLNWLRMASMVARRRYREYSPQLQWAQQGRFKHRASVA